MAAAGGKWKCLAPLLERLNTLSNPIPISGDNVNILYSPQQFFTALKVSKWEISE